MNLITIILLSIKRYEPDYNILLSNNKLKDLRILNVNNNNSNTPLKLEIYANFPSLLQNNS